MNDAFSPPAREGGPDLSGAVRLVLLLWLGLSVAFLVGPALLVEGFHYTHAWVTAHFATIGRAFAETGIVALSGVPVQNNPPLTTAPDIYISWPPLIGYVLAWVIRLFGDAEIVIHLFACTVTLSIAAMIFVLLHRDLGLAAGLAGAATFLNAPVIASYGHMASQTALGLLLLLLSIFFLQRARGWGAEVWEPIVPLPLILSVVFFMLAVASGWEAILAAPVLFVLALLAGDYRALRLSVLFGVCGAATIVAFMAAYFVTYPDYWDALTTRIQLRAGFGGSYDVATSSLFANPHFLHERGVAAVSKSHLDAILTVAKGAQNIGVLGILALVALFCLRLAGVRTDRGVTSALLLLLGGFVLWTVLMPHYTAIHDFQILVIAPVGALAVGLLLGHLPESFWQNGRIMAAVLASLMVVSIAYRLEETKKLITWSSFSAEAQLMQHLSQQLPEDALLLNTSPNMVPVYYAERHVIRAVTSDAVLAESVDGLLALCAECPVFMVVPARDEEAFQQSLSRFATYLDHPFGTVLAVDLSQVN